MAEGSLRSGTGHVITEFLRPANSYYYNLFKERNTPPTAIAQALRVEYTLDSRNRSLQLKARVYSEVHKQLPALLAAADANHYQKRFYRAVHEAFYNHLLDKFRWVETQESTWLGVPPGELRTTEVRMGQCESQQRRWPPLRSE